MTLLLPYEVWRDIKGYEGLYQISARGRVKSLARVLIRPNGSLLPYKDKFLSPWDNGFGYSRVTLHGVNKRSKHLVHRLVMNNFTSIPDDPLTTDINHKNGDRTDNDICNLEWCTRSENEFHKKYVLKKQIRPIIQMTMDGGIIKKWPSLSIAHREGGFDRSSIINACRGVFSQHKGFKWRYA